MKDHNMTLYILGNLWVALRWPLLLFVAFGLVKFLAKPIFKMVMNIRR